MLNNGKLFHKLTLSTTLFCLIPLKQKEDFLINFIKKCISFLFLTLSSTMFSFIKQTDNHITNDINTQ